MGKRVIVKFSLNPDHPVEAELIKRLNTVEVRNKSSHLKLAACQYFGILGQLTSANNPQSKDAFTGINRQTTKAIASFNKNNKKDEDPLDSSSVFASAFDNP